MSVSLRFVFSLNAKEDTFWPGGGSSYSSTSSTVEDGYLHQTDLFKHQQLMGGFYFSSTDNIGINFDAGTKLLQISVFHCTTGVRGGRRAEETCPTAN